MGLALRIVLALVALLGLILAGAAGTDMAYLGCGEAGQCAGARLMVIIGLVLVAPAILIWVLWIARRARGPR